MAAGFLFRRRACPRAARFAAFAVLAVLAVTFLRLAVVAPPLRLLPPNEYDEPRVPPNAAQFSCGASSGFLPL